MEGWQVCSLEEVVKFIDYRGRTPEKTEDGMRLITAKNVKMGYLQNEPMEFVDPKIYDGWMTRGIPKKGDVLFTTEAPLGNIAQLDTDEKVVFAQRIIVMQTSREVLDSTFLKYMLLSNLMQERIHEKGTGATVKGIKAQLLKKVQISFPNSLLEQRRIVAIVDNAFEGIDRTIANTKKNLANARELFESYLNAIFTQKGEKWKWVSFSQITTDITDGDHQPPPKAPSGIPFITISNIDKQNRKVDFSSTFKVSPEYFEKLKDNRKPRKGDLLYTVTGSYGIPVIVDHDMNFCFQRHIGLIRPNDATNPKCLYYMLLSRHLLKQADDCATGTAQKTVSLSALRRFSVPKIPKEEQEKIVDELDVLSEKIFRLEAIYQQKLAALNELKQSILQKAFTGELTADTANQATKTAEGAIAA